MTNPRVIGTILSMIRLEDHHVEALRKAAPQANFFLSGGRKELEKKIEEYMSCAEVVLFNPYWDRNSILHILNGPHLRWLQQFSAGSNWLMDYPEFVEKDIILTNASGIHAVPISEHVLAMILTLARDIQRGLRDQMKHSWGRKHWVTELEGSTMGLIGVGRIGEKTAEKAKALNMQVLGVRRNSTHLSPWVDQMFGPDSLMEMLSQADWVVIAAPLTQQTQGMIGERELKAMKKSAYLINIARGSIIQEKALIKALREGWIAGGGLDVFEEEPLLDRSPLWDMDNVIITAHYAGLTPQYNERLIEIFAENLRRYQSGEPLINVVDKRLGY
jgi:phosphoglycerate dehydrogenase-like enzyme